MTIRVAINGYGRIGRNVLRALYEFNRTDEFKIVAINALDCLDTTLHLTRYDSTHGRFMGDVYVEDEHLVVNGDKIKILNVRNPKDCPWKELDIDVMMECTGVFNRRDKAAQHLTAGAKKVLISAPGENADITVVYGVNHDKITAEHQVVSNASCTTNCLAPLVKPLQDAIGIESGLVVTTHAYTNDQVLIDSKHKDLRRARSATQSIIPTKTGAAKAVGLVLPELAGKLDGSALRVPTLNVSVIDLTFIPKRKTQLDEINAIILEASKNELTDILCYCDEPLVSIDFNHHSASSIYDATQTKILGNLVKVSAWYDNEWGFSCRMLDTAKVMMQAK